MKNISESVKKTYGSLPEKALQIGEGNFLRAFFGTIVEQMNSRGLFNGSIVMTPPRRWENCAKLETQDNIYTVLNRGVLNGRVIEKPQIVTSVSRCVDSVLDWEETKRVVCLEDLKVIVSNTTEAGIRYCKADSLDNIAAASYPAKLAALLYTRFKHFKGADKKLLILPTELIEQNGTELREYVLKYADDWRFGADFASWVDRSCCFANTLVDKIVSGFPFEDYAKTAEKLGYDDPMLVACEPFLFWAIECPKPYRSLFPADKCGLDIVFCDDIKPYKKRKVRILNGAHTATVLAAFLCGYDTVGEMMSDKLFVKYIDRLVYEEIIPAANMDNSFLKSFAASVFDRFGNPYIKHKLLDISLNSVSKFNARCKGTLLDAIRLKIDCEITIFSLAALICFYDGTFQNGVYFGTRGGESEKYEIRDSAEVLRFMSDAWTGSNPVQKILSNKEFWEIDLSEIDGLEQKVSDRILNIKEKGMRRAIEILLDERND